MTSDVHANIAALEAVLADIDHWVSMPSLPAATWPGDPNLQRPWSASMRALPEPVAFVKGNADRKVGERWGVEEGLPPWIAEINQ